MNNPVAMIQSVRDGDDSYKGIFLWCPGCEYRENNLFFGGLHLLPISGNSKKRPTWKWNGNLVQVTLSPSILTRIKRENDFVCHSFLMNGMWRFLSDCTHDLKNKIVPMKSLPDWVAKRD